MSELANKNDIPSMKLNQRDLVIYKSQNENSGENNLRIIATERIKRALISTEMKTRHQHGRTAHI